MIRMTSGQQTAFAIWRKAMKHSHKKLRIEEELAVDSQEDGMNEERSFLHPVSSEYVTTFEGEMNIVERGISLKGLRTILYEFLMYEDSFERFKAEDNDTKESFHCEGEYLIHMLVKPETKPSACYVEHLYGVFHKRSMNAKSDKETERISTEFVETLGTVNVFVSHAWQYDFEKVVKSIAHWEENWEKTNGPRHETFFYFLDYFAVNQHKPETDLKNLNIVIQKSKVTCLYPVALE